MAKNFLKNLSFGLTSNSKFLKTGIESETQLVK